MIDEVIAPICGNANFFRHKKSFMYYRITDNVLNFILFETKSFGFECWICVQPLFVFNEALILSLGNNVSHIDNKNFKNYYLYLEMDTEEISKNIEAHALFFRKTAFDWFDKVGNPKGISDYITSNTKESKVFFTPDEWRYEFKAYSDLYLGNYNMALNYFEKFITELTKNSVGSWDETIQKINSLIALIKTEPNKTNEILLQTVKKMIELLQLNTTA